MHGTTSVRWEELILRNTKSIPIWRVEEHSFARSLTIDEEPVVSMNNVKTNVALAHSRISSEAYVYVN